MRCSKDMLFSITSRGSCIPNDLGARGNINIKKKGEGNNAVILPDIRSIFSSMLFPSESLLLVTLFALCSCFPSPAVKRNWGDIFIFQKDIAEIKQMPALLEGTRY